MPALFHPLLLRSFARDRSALSALEFALILPIMVVLYLGGMELGDALTINRKVTHVTSSLADLITQAKTLTNNDMKNILDAAASVAAPYGNSTLRIKVSQVRTDSQGKTTVVWSDARNDTPLTPGMTVAIPDAVKENNTSIVMAEVHYLYTPTIGYVMTGEYDLSDKFYLRPRLVDSIVRIP